MNDYLPLIICVACARWRAPNNMHLFEGFCPSFYFSRPFKKRRFYLVRFFRFILSAFFVRAVVFIAPFRLPFKQKNAHGGLFKGMNFLRHLLFWRAIYSSFNMNGVFRPSTALFYQIFQLQIDTDFFYFQFFLPFWGIMAWVLNRASTWCPFFPFFFQHLFFFWEKGRSFSFRTLAVLLKNQNGA